MPGLIGWVGVGGAPPPAAPVGASWLLERPGLALGVLPRAPGDAARCGAAAGGRFLALHGHCFDSRSGAQYDAAALMAALVDEGEALLERLEGAFQACFYDAPLNRLRIFNDRLGILQLYWTRQPTPLAFAPRLAALPGVPRPLAPDPAGVVTFLAAGYCLGATTLCEQVKLLEPASLLDVDLASGGITRHRTWDLRFTPDHDASPAALAKQLYGAIVESVDLLTPARGEAAGLFLSGGWDCRGLLGAMIELGRPPAAVITNGVTDQLPQTDTALARRLAQDLGLGYRFCRREPERAAERSVQGIQQCELITDCCPEVFGQQHVPAGTFDGLGFIHKGDEVWGWKDHATTREQAIGNVMPTHLTERLKGLLRSDLAHAADSLYRDAIDATLEGCESADWDDRKDYLYLHGRETRYIFGLGSSDEEHIEVRRPFLTRKALEVVARIPAYLRVQKSLYLELLERHQPRLFRYGRNHASSTADYYSVMAPFVRGRVFEHLEAGHDLAGLLERNACAELLAAFQPAEQRPVLPTLRQRFANRVQDRWAHRWQRTKTYQQRSARAARPWSASDDALAFRVYLLLELFC